jgi:alkylation response protein AidB-like acyl-CoA dehydrogenase
MNFGLTEDQASILSGLDQFLESESPAAPTEPVTALYDADFDRKLAESGFLDIAREEGFGLLDAALVVERLAREPCAVEAAASALLAPALGLAAGTRPVALVSETATRAARFLPMAQVLVVDRGDDALIVDLTGATVEPVETLFAYPYGRLASLEGLETQIFADVTTVRRRWRIGLACEAAGCMAAGLAQVVEHVKTRIAFGRPLGSFQAIQHRLAMAAETAESTRWLALRAAYADSEADAAIAASLAQTRIGQLTYDLHQFCGAMGLTLEFPLHLWTYRLRALAGELGGPTTQSRAAALAAWPEPA